MTKRRHSYELRTPDGRPRLRGFHDDLRFMLAVDTRGRIRTLRYGINGMSNRLQGKQVIRGKRLVGYDKIELSMDAREEGWRSLESYYEDEVRDGKRKTMRDCDSVYAWYEQATARKSSGHIAPLVPPGHVVQYGPRREIVDPEICDGIHRAYLPAAVLEMRDRTNIRPIDLPGPEGLDGVEEPEAMPRPTSARKPKAAQAEASP